VLVFVLGLEARCYLENQLMFISLARCHTYVLHIHCNLEASADPSSLQHEVLASVAAGKHVILCEYSTTSPTSNGSRVARGTDTSLTGGHTNTERGYLPILAQKLHNELTEEGHENIDISISQNDEHPLVIV